MENLINFIDNLTVGSVLNQSDIDTLHELKNAIQGFKISKKEYKAKIEFPAKHLKQVYEFLKTLK